jgi:hypothetical protein
MHPSHKEMMNNDIDVVIMENPSVPDDDESTIKAAIETLRNFTDEESSGKQDYAQRSLIKDAYFLPTLAKAGWD